MNTTPNLGLSHIHANQGQKEVTANQFANGLDTAIAGSIIIYLDDKTEYTLTTVEARHAILIFKGVLTAPITIFIPTENANKKFIVAHESTGDFPIQLQHNNDSDHGITLQPNEKKWIYSHAENLYTLQTAPRLKTILFANPLILDWSDADRIFVELTADTQIEHTNALPGQTVTLILQQDNIGNHQVAWGENVRFGSDNSIILTTEAKKHDKLSFVFNDDANKCYDFLANLKGF